MTPITDENGAVVQLLAVSRDVTERRRDETFRAAQHQVLEMIATCTPLPDVLDSLVRLVEQQSDGMLCTVLLLDEDGIHVRHGAAPSLSADYLRAIDGSAIGPKAGSCGTAMYLGTRVVVTDILADPLWEDYRAVAQKFGLRACWSTPIFSPQRKVLGSFAMYYGEPRTPRDEELRLIETAADIARIAIEQERAYQALRQSEARNQAILRAIPDWMFLTTVDGVFLDYHARDATKLLVSPSAFLGRRVNEVLPPSVAAALEQAFARVSVSDEAEKLEYTLGADDAEHIYEAYIVRCDGDKVLSIVRDITDRKRAELEADSHRRELAHLSRVAMLGEMSGALAHELSQPLTAVLLNAKAARNLLDRQPLDVGQLRVALDDIIRNDKRAGAVIDRLRVVAQEGRLGAAAGRCQRGCPRSTRIGIRRAHVAAHHGHDHAFARNAARAGRSRPTAAGAAQSGVECVRRDEQHAACAAPACTLHAQVRWRRAAGRVGSWSRCSGGSARARVRAVRDVPGARPRSRAGD